MEWKDIKDAPKDGTQILVYVKNLHYEGCEIVRFSNGCWNNSFEGWYIENILGWMPLPEKPVKKHKCTHSGFNKSDVVNCYELDGKLFVKTSFANFKVDFCPFCGFTLKSPEPSLMPDPGYKSVTIKEW